MEAVKLIFEKIEVEIGSLKAELQALRGRLEDINENDTFAQLHYSQLIGMKASQLEAIERLYRHLKGEE